jgi:hypothetical protein
MRWLRVSSTLRPAQATLNSSIHYPTTEASVQMQLRLKGKRLASVAVLPSDNKARMPRSMSIDQHIALMEWAKNFKQLLWFLLHEPGERNLSHVSFVTGKSSAHISTSMKHDTNRQFSSIINNLKPDKSASTRRESAVELESSYLVGKRLFITDTNLVGYSNDSIQHADEIYLLAGGRVPFVLREHKHDSMNEPKSFRVVGGANIDGVMLGEMWPEDTDVSQLETIVLI